MQPDLFVAHSGYELHQFVTAVWQIKADTAFVLRVHSATYCARYGPGGGDVR
jgi:hypothetical protein